MGGESRYGVKAPRVVYEVFDEKVVVLDLESGSYYSSILLMPRRLRTRRLQLYQGLLSPRP